jgi:signal transduction histidine kinase
VVEVAVSAIEREDVQIMIILGRNITEEVTLGREKELLSEQLAHSQRLEAVGRLAGGVAHDFNNYIHAIIGHLDVIRYIYKSEDEKINRRLDKICDISEQAGHLTGQLLGFARKGKFNVKEIDLRKLLQDSIDLFLPKSHRNLDFEYQVKDRPMLILGDSVQLQQAMLNLMLNAMDAMEQKGSTEMLMKVVADDATNSPLELLPPDGKKVDPSHFFCIIVQDNGTGMSKKTQQRIFEPFFTTKPYGKGTGMGLAMVYGTITNHGGWVQLESSENKGTAFYLFLPKKQFAEKVVSVQA